MVLAAEKSHTAQGWCQIGTSCLDPSPSRPGSAHPGSSWAVPWRAQSSPASLPIGCITVPPPAAIFPQVYFRSIQMFRPQSRLLRTSVVPVALSWSHFRAQLSCTQRSEDRARASLCETQRVRAECCSAFRVSASPPRGRTCRCVNVSLPAARARARPCACASLRACVRARTCARASTCVRSVLSPGHFQISGAVGC